MGFKTFSKMARIALVVPMIFSSTAFGEAGGPNDDQIYNRDSAQTTTPAQGTTGGQQPGGTQYILPPSGGGGNAAQSGRDASRQQLMSAAINVGAATMYMSICTGCSVGAGCWACPFIPLAAAAASMLGRQSSGSDYAGAQMEAMNPYYGVPPGGTGGTGTDPWGNPITDGSTGGNGNNGNGTGPGNGTTGTGTAGTGGGGLPPGTTPQTIARDVARIRAELEKTGVKISPDGKTMTTPDGRKFDMSKVGSGSESDLSAMGLSPSEISQANAASKKFAANAASKMALSKIGADGGGGGGGLRGPADEAGAGGGAGGYGYGMGDRDPRNRNRKKPKISGLTKKLGNDTIGVAGDDIFEMVTRRYKARDQENGFLKD